jgi:transposase InsO family protein
VQRRADAEQLPQLLQHQRPAEAARVQHLDLACVRGPIRVIRLTAGGMLTPMVAGPAVGASRWPAARWRRSCAPTAGAAWTRARRTPRTTEADPGAARAPDLVGRRWRVAAPNLLEVADFTYAPMVSGFGYSAFVIDAYAGLIPGWECSLTKDTAFVERALRHAAAFRARQGHPFDGAIHHTDAGSQYTAIHFTEVLMLAGLTPSIGSVGDALDNGLAETTIGLYKTECIREGSPFRTGPIRTLADLEDITSAWVALVQLGQADAPARAPPARRG